MRRTIVAALLTCSLAVPGAARAQRDSAGASAPIGPPIRRIATASAMSAETFGSINEARELPGGRLLVNDGQRRRLLLVDTTFRTLSVVLDSISETENTYGTRAGTMIGFRGDSIIFIDPVSLALLVIDPAGNVARVRSVPRVQDLGALTSNSGQGRTGTDAKGRLVYRISARPARPAMRPPRGVPYIPQEPDSAFVVGIDIDTRRVDTLGSIRIPKSDFTVRMLPGGQCCDFISSINPLPLTDDWAVLADGAVAFVRGLDYRIDYLNGDGSWSSSPKLPYDWQRVSDEDKRRIVDSLKATQLRNAQTSYLTSLVRWVNLYGKRTYPAGLVVPEGYRPPQGWSKDWVLPPGVSFPTNYIFACAVGEEPVMSEPNENAASRPAAANAPPPAAPSGEIALGPPGVSGRGRPSCIPAPIPNLAQVPQPPRLRPVSVIDADQLPDYKPPFGSGATRGDADGNLWIRVVQPRPVPGGQIYDIVSRAGELIDRIQLPQGYTIVGFGKGRVVYLSMRDPSGIKLARVVLAPR
jgi:hypothetical protein